MVAIGLVALLIASWIGDLKLTCKKYWSSKFLESLGFNFLASMPNRYYLPLSMKPDQKIASLITVYYWNSFPSFFFIYYIWYIFNKIP